MMIFLSHFVTPHSNGMGRCLRSGGWGIILMTLGNDLNPEKSTICDIQPNVANISVNAYAWSNFWIDSLGNIVVKGYKKLETVLLLTFRFFWLIFQNQITQNGMPRYTLTLDLGKTCVCESYQPGKQVEGLL